MKKILGILFFTVLLIPVNDVLAVRPGQFFKYNEIKPTIRAIKEEVKPTIAAIREETKESIRLTITASPSAKPWEIRKEIREKNKGLLEEIKNQVKEKLQALRFNARLTGKITEIGGNYIKVSDNKDGKIYQVNITEKTQLRRHFGGKSSLSEFSVGDEVNVIGRYTDETKSTIEAVLIRNKSILKKWGAFFGDVLSKEGNVLTIKTVSRGDFKVYIVDSTKLINRREQVITLDDIQVGHRIRAKGVWDSNLKEIKETDEVKDFSLPPPPMKSLTPTKAE
jgi:hypothetical protein